MFKIYGGDTAFRQWEQGYVLTNDCMNVGDEVVFRNSTGKTIPVNAREDGGAVVVDVPNELLMDCSNIVVELGQGSERHHECVTTFEVERCDKPSGYVCKPNEYRAPTNAPDWNQNDPSGVGYVKNRPHYTESTRVTLLDGSFDLKDNGASPYLEIAFDTEFVVGQTYEVIWDGVPYSCVAYIYEEANAPAIGSTAWGDGGNGEPFWFLTIDGILAISGTTVGTHTVNISSEREIVHKIDGKYLPEGSGYIETKMVDFVCRAGRNADMLNVPAFYEGQTVEITVDGVEYSLVAKEQDGLIYIGDYINDLDTNPQYGWTVMSYPGDDICPVVAECNSEKKRTFSCLANVPHKINPRCLPQIYIVDDVENESQLVSRFNTLLRNLREAGYLATVWFGD